jgi:hypothetical protein
VFQVRGVDINLYFIDQEISGDILLELTLDSLKELQVTTFGKRFKIHNAINALRQENKRQKVCSIISKVKFLLIIY